MPWDAVRGAKSQRTDEGAGERRDAAATTMKSSMF
jgi:hypothetical protein